MATLMSDLITTARLHLNEPTANFWSDAELLTHGNHGVKDLWRAIIDLHQGHFLTINEADVSMPANSNELDDVPEDVFRVELIEVRDLTTANSVQDMVFMPRPINHPDVSGARGVGPVSPSGQTIYYTLFNAGAPIDAPSIEVAPQITAEVELRFVYTPVLAALASDDDNPIPGESDHAVVAWIVAHARAKEREDRMPDPGWLQMYATDKRALLTALTPRQTQEPDYVEAFFEPYW